MSARRPAALAVALVASTFPTVGAVAAAAPGPVPSSTSWAAASCAGRVPTIVGTSGVIRGTRGPDVVVAAGSARQVLAGDGDDVVCVRVRAGRRITLQTGAGDDRVVVQRARGVTAFLGAGDDTYLGGDAEDEVYTEVDTFDSPESEWPRGGRNLVRTRGGRDVVISGGLRGPNPDRVHLGADDDLAAPLGGGTLGSKASPRFAGGGGLDELNVLVRRRATLLVDAVAGRASVGERGIASWSGIEAYALANRGRQVFLGSDADETVEFEEGNAPLVARTGGGDDAISFGWGGEEHAERALVDAGPGRDLLTVESGAESTVASLATGTFETRAAGYEVRSFGLRGVEDLAVRGSGPDSRIELLGDAGANELLAEACEVVLRGGAGDDVLRVGGQSGSDARTALPYDGVAESACRGISQVFGEDGDDVMVARGFVELGRLARRAFDDLLDGGTGNDSADGGDGGDTCVAEARVDCEA